MASTRDPANKNELSIRGDLQLVRYRLTNSTGPPTNEALAAYFERDKQDQRMYRETLEGLADVEAGRVIDGDRVMAWIESWGSDNELPQPCT